MTLSSNGSASKIDSANKKQISQGLMIQASCLAVLSQQSVAFSKDEAQLAKYQDQINDVLSKAQAHANTYLDNIQPQLISNMANISSYYALHQAVPTALPSGSSADQWVEVLKALQQQAQTFEQQSSATLNTLNAFVAEMTRDLGGFGQLVTDFHAALSGDNGVLAQNNERLQKINKDIDDDMAKIIAGAIALVGGVISILVGALVDAVTGGAVIGLVIGGGIACAAGATSLGLGVKSLISSEAQKAGILSADDQIRAEVKVAQALGTGFNQLTNQISNAVDAAQDMSNAWSSLKSDLSALINNMDNGLMQTGECRTLFLTASNTEVKSVITDIAIIKQQLDGVKTIKASKGQSLVTLLDHYAA